MLWGSVCESSWGSRKEDGSETASSGCDWRLWSCSGRFSLEYSVYHSWIIKVWNRIRVWLTKPSVTDCLDFLTCISSSYIFMLRSVLVLDLRPWYTRDMCCTQHTHRGEKQLSRSFIKENGDLTVILPRLCPWLGGHLAESWWRTVLDKCVCRTPERTELHHDSPLLQTQCRSHLKLH